MLVLAGVTVGAFFTALQTFVQQHSVQNLQEIYSFILGGIATASWHDVGLVSPYVVVAAIVVLLHARVLDVLALGDTEAASLGINVRRTRLIVVIAATDRHGRGRLGQRPDRLRRHHRPALRPARAADGQHARAAAALARAGRRVPRALRPRRAHGRVARRAADRDHHGVPRRPVLRRRPALGAEDRMSAVG